MTEDERELLKSIGLLELVQETNNHAPAQEPQTTKSLTELRDGNGTIAPPSEENSRAGGLWPILRSLVKRPDSLIEEKSPVQAASKHQHVMKEPTSYNQLDHAYVNDQSLLSEQFHPDEKSSNKLMLGIGGTLFLLPHLAILLSLPPVLQRRGAPYLPTFKSKLNVMFDLIRVQVQTQKGRNLQFVDLGSGDGRVVFRAAREGLFNKSVGYEINPTLHLFAQSQKLFTPKYWQTTRFECGDLWRIQLSKYYDVVAVYGVAPIMDRLGVKMKEELKPGSIVVSFRYVVI